MHRIALEVTDDPTVQVDLMKVPTAVVQVVQLSLVRQCQRLQIAQFVIAVLQQPGTVGFAEQLPVRVIGVIKLLLLTLVVRERDGQQVVGGVVAVVGDAILGAFAQQAANGITLEIMANRSGPCRRGVVGEGWLFV
ncbi:hypothetical protein D3C81_1228640 [compost metagenome]